MEIEDLNLNPLTQFNKWFEEAKLSNIDDYQAMALATVNQNGYPSARMVLLKYYSESGFTFFTNYNSKKADCLAYNANCALVLYWRELGKQIRIEGYAKKVSHDETIKYFQSRERNSQISAWASKQSQTLTSRQDLEAQFQSFKNQFAGQEVPTPDFWGGYTVKPRYYEFWMEQEHRLSDRFAYNLNGDTWEIARLYP